MRTLSVLETARALCWWVHLGDGCDCSRASLSFESVEDADPVLRLSWRSGVDGEFSCWDVELRPGSLLGVCVDRSDPASVGEDGPATMEIHSFRSLDEFFGLPCFDDFGIDWNDLPPERILDTFYDLSICFQTEDDFLYGKGAGSYGDAPTSCVEDWPVVRDRLLALDSFWSAPVGETSAELED